MHNLLFDIEEKPVPEVSGLQYSPDFISVDEE